LADEGPRSNNHLLTFLGSDEVVLIEADSIVEIIGA